MYEAMTEDQLVVLAKSADGGAFVELMRRTRPVSMRTACSILKDSDAAQDQVQSAYLNAWRQMHAFRSEAKFSTWISRIVTNQCLMALRSRKRAPLQMAAFEEGSELMPEFPDPSPGCQQTCEEQEERELIRRELKCVPPFLRKAIDMVYFAEIPIPEAARQLGVSVPAFKSRLSRARAFLKQRLEKHYVAV
jgi:RNA polymerase sigma-70 factor, ECF subfamily